MTLGIMTRMYQRSSLVDLAEAVRADGLTAVQLNLSSAGIPSLPDSLDSETATRIGDVFRSKDITVAAVSGTFNAIHPDPAVRRDGIRRVSLLASRSRDLGTRIITLCSGTRAADSPWRYHEDSYRPDAWSDLLETLHRLLDATEDSGVRFGVEPEVANVVDSPAAARRLLTEIGSPRLGIVMDPANLVRPSDVGDTPRVIEEAFAVLGPSVILAHAKDITGPEPGGRECLRVAPGRGVLDFRLYLRLLQEAGYTGSLIMHDLAETEVKSCARHLRLQSLGAIGN